MTKEQEKEYFDAMDKYHNEQYSKWNKAKEELKGLIESKYFDFAESNDTYYSEGIVDIEKFKPQYTSYPNSEHCKTNVDSLTYIKTTSEIESHYGKESEHEGEPVEYFVWQQTGLCEDDYSGFLLLPLMDGKRFWKVGYSC